jgi:hypothetical protein
MAPMWTNGTISNKVKELAEQAQLQPYYDAQEIAIAKIVELTVNECIRLIPGDCTVDGIHLSWVLAKHFDI